MSARRALIVAHVIFLATMILHGLDHVRQGTDRLWPYIFLGGTALGIIALAPLPLTLKGHPKAPLAAAVVGLGTAVAVTSSHIVPHWSVFSDPYPALHVDGLSWAAMLAEVVAAMVFGLIGFAQLRRAAEGSAAS